MTEDAFESTCVSAEDLAAKQKITDDDYNILKEVSTPYDMRTMTYKYLTVQTIMRVLGSPQAYQQTLSSFTRGDYYFDLILHMLRKICKEMKMTGPKAPILDYDKVIYKFCKFLPVHIVFNAVLRSIVEEFKTPNARLPEHKKELFKEIICEAEKSSTTRLAERMKECGLEVVYE